MLDDIAVLDFINCDDFEWADSIAVVGNSGILKHRNDAEDIDRKIKKAANSISWRMAGCEAILGLICNNLILVGSENYYIEKQDNQGNDAEKNGRRKKVRFSEEVPRLWQQGREGRG